MYRFYRSRTWKAFHSGLLVASVEREREKVFHLEHISLTLQSTWHQSQSHPCHPMVDKWLILTGFASGQAHLHVQTSAASTHLQHHQQYNLYNICVKLLESSPLNTTANHQCQHPLPRPGWALVHAVPARVVRDAKFRKSRDQSPKISKHLWSMGLFSQKMLIFDMIKEWYFIPSHRILFCPSLRDAFWPSL